MQNPDMTSIGSMNFDAIVVGTGPGGATVAKGLSAKGKKVLILEWGSISPVRGTFWQFMKEAAMHALITPQLLGMVRGISTGGSSTFYYGTAFPVPHAMMKKYGIDVRDEEKELRKELPIGPLKDEMVTPMARRIMESGRALGYDWKKLDKFMYQDRWRPGYMFGYYGDPHKVRWDSRMFAEEAVKNGAVMLNGTKVKNIIMEGSTAVGVEFRMNMKKYRVFGSKIIIAAGGIASPMLLRKIGIMEAGNNYFFDPLVSACGKVSDVRMRDDEIPMTFGCHLPEDGIVLTDMAQPPMIDFFFTAMAFRFHRIFERRKTLRIMIKIRDDLAGTLSGPGWVFKMLTRADKDKLNKGYEIAKKILEKAGAKGIYKTWKLAAHPGGTIKIGEMVDSNLKVKNRENLYVCDCSVIPEPWGLPPTLTILCLGKRLSKHLAGEKKKTAEQEMKKKKHEKVKSPAPRRKKS
jgi:choline dehydrogenase-like flavoprotein